MRKLNVFFDILRFLAGKRLLALSSSDWIDYKSRDVLGTKVELVIMEDNTVYPADSKGEIPVGINRFEKMTVKVPGKKISIPKDAEVTLVNPTATIYGDFSDKLSLTAEDVKLVTPGKQ